MPKTESIPDPTFSGFISSYMIEVNQNAQYERNTIITLSDLLVLFFTVWKKISINK